MIDIDKIKKYYDHVLTQVYAETESNMHEMITKQVWDNITVSYTHLTLPTKA